MPETLVPPEKEERENPQPSKCLGIFNLSLETNEKDLHDMFFRFGPIEDVTLVTDKVTKRSRGFGFVYFKNVEDAEIAKEKVQQMIVHGKELRVDFSVTQRPHTPTPGVYLGKKPQHDSHRRYVPPSVQSGGAKGGLYSDSRRRRELQQRVEEEERERSEVRVVYRSQDDYTRAQKRQPQRDWTDYPPPPSATGRRRRLSPRYERPHYY